MKVNYNVTGNERKELVRVISETIGEKSKYLGMPSAAYQIGGFTVSKIGELIWDETTDIETLGKVTSAIGAAGFDCEDEIPAVEPQNDLTEDKTDEAQEDLAEEQDTASAEITGDRLTIEMPREFYSETTLENLKKLVESKATIIKEAVDASELPILVTEDKISFPWFSSLEEEEVYAYTAFISKLSIMAKEAKRVTAKDHPVDNPKYAMRCFLLRLGFIGSGYKTVRKVLLKNLSGNSSWKNGKKEGASDEITE